MTIRDSIAATEAIAMGSAVVTEDFVGSIKGFTVIAGIVESYLGSIVGFEAIASSVRKKEIESLEVGSKMNRSAAAKMGKMASLVEERRMRVAARKTKEEEKNCRSVVGRTSSGAAMMKTVAEMMKKAAASLSRMVAGKTSPRAGCRWEAIQAAADSSRTAAARTSQAVDWATRLTAPNSKTTTLAGCRPWSLRRTPAPTTGQVPRPYPARWDPIAPRETGSFRTVGPPARPTASRARSYWALRC